MRGEPLEFKHKPLIINKLSRLGLSFCDFSFATLFLWRKANGSRIEEINGITVIHSCAFDKQEMIIPLDPVPLHYESYDKTLSDNKKWQLFPIPLDWANQFPGEGYFKDASGMWTDYVYQTSVLASYSGRALDGKRNQVNHFLDRYTYEIVIVSPKYQKELLELLDTWKKSHPLKDDYMMCKEAIENMELLQLEGILVLSEGKPVGFAIGVPLNEEVFDVMFAKADISYQGVYSFLFQNLAKSIKQKYMNYEFDLGIPGLRKSKIEYAPDHFEVKWGVRRR